MVQALPLFSTNSLRIWPTMKFGNWKVISYHSCVVTKRFLVATPMW
jgi:hypothetical protein